MSVKNIDFFLEEELSYEFYYAEIDFTKGFKLVGFEAKFFSLFAQRGFQSGFVFDDTNQGLNFLRIKVLDQGENPAFRAIKAGGAAELEYLYWFGGVCHGIK